MNYTVLRIWWGSLLEANLLPVWYCLHTMSLHNNFTVNQVLLGPWLILYCHVYMVLCDYLFAYSTSMQVTKIFNKVPLPSPHWSPSLFWAPPTPGPTLFSVVCPPSHGTVLDYPPALMRVKTLQPSTLTDGPACSHRLLAQWHPSSLCWWPSHVLVGSTVMGRSWSAPHWARSSVAVQHSPGAPSWIK